MSSEQTTTHTNGKIESMSRARQRIEASRNGNILSKALLEKLAPGPNGERCIGRSEYYFAEEGDSKYVKDLKTVVAKALCELCPLRTACLEGAIIRGEDEGVWGGVAIGDIHNMSDRRLVKDLALQQRQ